MSTPFQNRLVGTIIVSAAAIIFLPDLLSGKKTKRGEEFEAIPKPPAFEAAAEQKAPVFPTEKLAVLNKDDTVDETALDEDQEQPGTFVNNDNVQVQVLDKPVKFSSAEGKDPTITAENLTLPSIASTKTDQQEHSWVIQLGSFKHKQNVDDLTSKLKDNGYTVFTRPIKTKKGVLTKVFIGPEINKSALESKLPALKELTNVQGKLAPFEINS